jgi:hypothetical protein
MPNKNTLTGYQSILSRLLSEFGNRDQYNHPRRHFYFPPSYNGNKQNIKKKQIQNIAHDERLFPITYAEARGMVIKAGSLVYVHLAPHDRRRFAATDASRCETPNEFASKEIL